MMHGPIFIGSFTRTVSLHGRTHSSFALLTGLLKRFVFNPYHDQYGNREATMQNSLENLIQLWLFYNAKG